MVPWKRQHRISPQECCYGWMNGVLGHFYALSRLNWAGMLL